MYNNSPYLYHDDLSYGAQPTTANFPYSTQLSYDQANPFDHFSGPSVVSYSLAPSGICFNSSHHNTI